MKISLTIYIDPLRLDPECSLGDVHMKAADAFAKILSNENLIEINGFDISVDYDQDTPNVPSTAAYDWFKRFSKMSTEQRKNLK